MVLHVDDHVRRAAFVYRDDALAEHIREVKAPVVPARALAEGQVAGYQLASHGQALSPRSPSTAVAVVSRVRSRPSVVSGSLPAPRRYPQAPPCRVWR